MEKFAVDLDKVLDDFEFNEDCAEQVASIAPARVSHPDQRSKDHDLSSSGKTLEHLDEEKSWHSKSHITDTIDIRKSDDLHNNDESVNNFSTRAYQMADDKVQEKRVVDFRDNDEPSSTIHNDITQKLVMKKQNDNQTSKNHNSYDKKLNQPNIKPSVSNVFNSLNEYINATTTNMENISCTIDCQKERNGKLVINPENNDTQIPEAKSQRPVRVLPAYQNILLPMKCEPSVSTQIPNTENDMVESMTTGQHRKQGKVDCAEHIYENIQFGQSLPASKTSRVQEASRSSSQDETKHIYENVDFDQSSGGKNDDTVYACIYIGNKDMPETTTELEKAAKRLTEQFPDNIVSSVDKKSSGREGESLVFQNVNLNVTTERKPVGFSTIDDLSEEELNKYLAELEAEERAKEEAVIYENLSVPGPSSSAHHSLKEQTRCIPSRHADEDANEAPIFESVTIGELPRVSEQKLQEKAKKLRVIDYSKSGTSAESSNFLDQKSLEKFTDCDKLMGDAKGNISNKTTVGGKSSVSDSGTSRGSNGEEIAGEKEQHIEQRNDNSEKKISRAEAGDATISDETSSHQDRQTIGTSGGAVEGSSTADGPQGDDFSTDIAKGEDENNSTIGEEDYVEENVDKSARPQTLDIVSSVSMEESPVIDSSETASQFPSSGATCTQEQNPTIEESQDHLREPSPDASDNSSMEFGIILGKQPPFWIPDGDAPNCMLCDVKFNVIKRRHHCRACGKVLCNKCCSMKYRLEYQGNMDSRVCALCYQQLIRAETEPGGGEWASGYLNNVDGGINSPQGRQPNPNNPMEYCSTIPPLQQLAGNLPPPPTVMVPVGVLKREGSTKQRTEGQKSVMFSDGIRPGCDLTELDTSWNPKPPYRKASNKRIASPGQQSTTTAKRQNLPPLDPHTNSYIPGDTNMLPPTVTIHKGQISYQEVGDSVALYELLKNENEPPVMFAINRNLYAYVKMTNLNCCVNKLCWNVTSRGLACVGQDEVILLVEALPDETQLPKDLLIHINQIYVEAVKGNTVTELGVSIHQEGTLMGSREHAGFLFIRQTFQCLQKIVLPPPPFLVGLLVHRWETPWAKIFPLRLVLRLGAEYRYYPCPLVSVRFRNAVYFEIGHTIMKVLADFRNYAYTLPGVRGMVIHMQDRTTDVLFPRNRYDQVIKGLNNSNDHVLAFAANFSIHVDSHLVCIQTNTGDESNYQTQAINIHNKPRKITGASFVVINGALKSSMGLSAKSSIVEDGLMVQIMPEKMEALKAALKNMHDFTIDCGRQGVPEPDETVNIKWVDNDVQFNQGLKSPIDNKPMDGIPSIRVHNGNDYMGTSRFIRWTEVFIIKSDDHPNGVHDPVDLNKLSESIARATCAALVKLLDLLAAAGLTKLAVRATIHPDNVGYEAGSEGTRLPPIYMNSLDNELIQVLHKAAQSSQDANTVLELIFHVLDD